MKITDEMVDAASAAYAEATKGFLCAHPDPMRAALEAALGGGDELFTDLGDDFDVFWSAYPRRIGKPAALKAYKLARGRRKAKHADIMAGLARFKASNPDPEFTPYPATWLNQDRWQDEPVVKAAKGSDIFFASAERQDYAGGRTGTGEASGGRHALGVSQRAIGDHRRDR